MFTIKNACAVDDKFDFHNKPFIANEYFHLNVLSPTNAFRCL